ncbi:hypothetical protein EDC04DRAFT_326941 [Pisolithus marmoratus]|nr:hypothetical protein EDC04DRAFT_326941 [Pisolithus marmoratus]
MMTRKRSSLAFVSAGRTLGASATALFAVRVSSPAIIFLTTLSLLCTKPLSPPSPSPITPVVVQSRVPRTTLILVLLSLSALSFLIDGLAYVAYAVFNKVWSLGTGIPLASVLGLVAYAGLAALGAWKDINHIRVWFLARVRLAIAIALALDISAAILNCPSVSLTFSTSSRRASASSSFSHSCSPSIHPVSPTIMWRGSPNWRRPGRRTLPLQEDGPTAESSKYGTFAAQDQCESGPPPTSLDIKSSFTTLRRLRRYICPSTSKRIEFAFVFTTCLHLIVRVLKPLLPILLGAAVNAFIPQSAVTYPIPMPLGTSPYPYIFVFAITCFLTSQGGIPALILSIVWYWVILVLPLSSIPCSHGTLLDVRSVLDVLSEPAEVIDCGKASLDGEGGVEVRFENVSFTYPYSANHAQPYGPLLSSVSFTLPASSTVALVGAPGSGSQPS